MSHFSTQHDVSAWATMPSLLSFKNDVIEILMSRLSSACRPVIHDVDAHVIAELFKLCPKAQRIV